MFQTTTWKMTACHNNPEILSKHKNLAFGEVGGVGKVFRSLTITRLLTCCSLFLGGFSPKLTITRCITNLILPKKFQPISGFNPCLSFSTNYGGLFRFGAIYLFAAWKRSGLGPQHHHSQSQGLGEPQRLVNGGKLLEFHR